MDGQGAKGEESVCCLLSPYRYPSQGCIGVSLAFFRETDPPDGKHLNLAPMEAMPQGGDHRVHSDRALCPSRGTGIDGPQCHPRLQDGGEQVVVVVLRR
jgi:hypothetical protein